MATGLIGLQLFLLAYESRLVQFVLVKPFGYYSAVYLNKQQVLVN